VLGNPRSSEAAIAGPMMKKLELAGLWQKSPLVRGLNRCRWGYERFKPGTALVDLLHHGDPRSSPRR